MLFRVVLYRNAIATKIVHLASTDRCCIAVKSNRMADRVIKVKFSLVSVWVNRNLLIAIEIKCP